MEGTPRAGNRHCAPSAAWRQLQGGRDRMKFTLIFKVPSSAGQLPVPLAASMDDEKDVSGELERYKGQAKKIMRQTSSTSPSPCTIEVTWHRSARPSPGHVAQGGARP